MSENQQVAPQFAVQRVYMKICLSNLQKHLKCFKTMAA